MGNWRACRTSYLLCNFESTAIFLSTYIMRACYLLELRSRGLRGQAIKSHLRRRGDGRKRGRITKRFRQNKYNNLPRIDPFGLVTSSTMRNTRNARFVAARVRSFVHLSALLGRKEKRKKGESPGRGKTRGKVRETGRGRRRRRRRKGPIAAR